MLYETAGKLRNETGKNVLSPDQCQAGSWQFDGGPGPWVDDKHLKVEKIGEILSTQRSSYTTLY